jgi:Tfp pilus assembly protein PilO
VNEKKRLLFAIVVSLVLAGGVGASIYLQNRKINEDRVQAATLRTKIDADRKLITKTPDLVKEVIIQRETDEVIREILSDEQDINNLVRTLQRFVEESGVSISAIKEQKTANRGKNKEDFERVGYTLSFEGDAFQLLSFLDRVESHSRFMAVTAFKLSAARRKDYEDGPPRHKVQLDLETYVYTPKAGLKEVRIDNYERKRDLLVSEISRRASELRVAVYEYRGPRSRRDPGVDPRVPVTGDGGPILSIEEQIAMVDDLVARADEAEELWEQVRAAENLISEMKSRSQLLQKIALLDEEVRRVQNEGKLIFIPATRLFQKDVVEVLESLQVKINQSETGRGPSLAALRETADAMKRSLESGEYEMALDTFRTIEPRLDMASRDEFKRPLVQTLRELERLTKTVLEFEKIDMHIAGIALYEDRRPVALINGHAVQEGELVGEELLVRNITREEIEFVFRGMVLARRVEGE